MIFLIELRGLTSFCDQWFARYRFWVLLTPFWSLLTLFGHFWALPVIWQVWYIWNINRNMIFLIKMRGLPSFYNQRFARYRFLALLIPFYALLTPCCPFLPYLGIFENLRSSEKYEINMKQSLKHDIFDWNEGFSKFLQPKVNEI